MNKIFKILSIQNIILCFLAIFMPISKAEVTLTIGNGSGLPGSTGNPLEVSLTNSINKVRAIELDICEDPNYPNFITPTNNNPPDVYTCETTDRTANFWCLTNEIEDPDNPAYGCCRVLLFDIEGSLIEQGEGAIFILRYDVSLSESSYDCRTLNAENVDIVDDYNQPLDVTIVSGRFCFPCTSDADCEDYNGCTIDTCIDEICYNTTVDDETPCNDGDLCTENDMCINGTCIGYPKDCSYLDDQCILGVCNPFTGECEEDLSTENGKPCDDGLYCNGDDACSGGSCSAHTGNPCQGQICNEDDNRCEAITSSSTTTSTTPPKTTTTTTKLSTTTTITTTTTTIISIPDCRVTIDPASKKVFPGGTIKFSANTSCEGEMETPIYLWAVDSDIRSNIDENGFYRAGTRAGTDIVRVIDRANGDAEATAEVAITFPWPLAYDKMWGAKKNENLLLLRIFRDEILLGNEIGKRYTSMLYANSLEIAILLLKDPLLASQAREIANDLLMKVDCLLYNDEIEIRKNKIEDFISLLNHFESKASPKLKTAIRKVKSDINRGKIFEQLSITITE